MHRAPPLSEVFLLGILALPCIVLRTEKYSTSGSKSIQSKSNQAKVQQMGEEVPNEPGRVLGDI